MAMPMDLDELVEHWTLLEDERQLVAGKRGATRLGFALALKFYARAGRFPRGRAELDDDAVAFVARQVGVLASDLGFYEWSGRTAEYHRAQVRRHLGFRECSAEDADAFRSRCRQAMQASGPGVDCPEKASLASIIPEPSSRSRSAGRLVGATKVSTGCRLVYQRTAGQPLLL